MTEKNTNDTLCVIIPVWGEKELVPVLYARLTDVLRSMSVKYQIIYVNDACPFGSGIELEKLATKDENVKVINLSRNFGEAAAVKAGIDYCDADHAIVMDCDLQDKPEDIPLLLNKAKEGYDIVWGERISRQDSFSKKFFSQMFRFISNLISEQKIDKKIGSFSCISRNVIDELKKCGDYTFHYIQAVEYLGFKKTYVPVEKAKRETGKSGYNIAKAASLALKILINQSIKPLFIPFLSALIMLICFISAVFCACLRPDLLKDNTIFMFSFFIFFAFLLFFNLGIIALYIGIILKETLTKPRYVIKNIKCRK